MIFHPLIFGRIQALPITEVFTLAHSDLVCPQCLDAWFNHRHPFHAGGRPGGAANFGSFHGHGPLDDRLRDTLCHLFRLRAQRFRKVGVVL